MLESCHFTQVAYQLLNSLCEERDTSQYEDVGLLDIFVILAPECWESPTFENQRTKNQKSGRNNCFQLTQAENETPNSNS